MAVAGKKTNWFAIWMSVAVAVVVVVVGAVVVVINNSATDPGPAPQSAVINSETGAIEVGDGPDVVGSYIDFMCPNCNQFESVYGETLNGLVADGSITLEIHPVAILDRLSQQTNFSTRAANAMYCVAEFDSTATVPFMAAMYANQPAENSTGLTDEQILEIARGVGVSDIDTCVTEQSYARFVAAKTALIPKDEQGRQGTPTVTFNGERITLTGDPKVDIVARLKG